MLPARRSSALYVLAALLGVPILIPSILWRDGPWRSLSYSFEYGLAVLLTIAVARTRVRHVVRWLVVTLYAVLILFLSYAYAFSAFFYREPALVEDWQFAINLLHFLEEMSWRWLLSIAAGLVMATGLVIVVNRTLAALQRQEEATPARAIAFAVLVWSSLGIASALARGPVRFSGAKVVDNYRASVSVRARLSALVDGGRDDRYRDLMKVRLAKRPTFYFLVIEAYGEVLATWDMAAAYRALMERVGARLEAAGYHSRTAYSAAPVHGGRSWLSLATLQSGILIDQPESFAAFQSVSLQIPTLIGFFRQQGYHTASLEPGTKERGGVGKDDLYGHELRIAAPQLGYTGKQWGFGGIPDEYSLETFRVRHLGALAEPRYLFFMSVSTHYPWSAETVPRIEARSDWPPLPGMDAVTSEFRRYYLKSVEYDWRVLTDFLEAERSPEIVIVILGDHQPRLESNSPTEVTFHTPIHVISRDSAFVERFAPRGFQAGLHAEPGRDVPLVHEALFSLLVTELAGAYGTPETKWLAKHHPQGVGLQGLTP